MHTIVCGLAAITIALIGASAVYKLKLCDKPDRTYAKNYLLRTLTATQYAEYRAEVMRSKKERSNLFWSTFAPLVVVSYYVINTYINAEYVKRT